MVLELVIALLSGLVGWSLKHYWERKNYTLALRDHVQNWVEHVQFWSESVIDCMNRIHYELDWSQEGDDVLQNMQNREQLALELSILVEKGRLYLPNENRSTYGQEKQSSRRGYRSAVLDPLVATIVILRAEDVPKFDFEDKRGKYGRNRYSRAVRLYSNAFLSFIEVVLAVREGNRRRISFLRKIGASGEANRMERLLSPSDEVPPPSHRYWLGSDLGARIPREEEVLDGGWQ